MDTNKTLREIRAAQARYAALLSAAEAIADPGIRSDRDEAANGAFQTAAVYALALVDALGNGEPLPDEWTENIRQAEAAQGDANGLLATIRAALATYNATTFINTAWEASVVEIAENTESLLNLLDAGEPLPDEWRTNRKVEIAHDRDPDSSCTHDVYLDGQPIHALIESTDPGAGQQQSDWEEELHSLAADTTMSPTFRQAALDSHKESFDSSYVEKNPADDCVPCKHGVDLPHEYVSRGDVTDTDACPRCGGVVGADTCEDCHWPLADTRTEQS